jgi:type II secretory pathway pseudopilin PulG
MRIGKGRENKPDGRGLASIKSLFRPLSGRAGFTYMGMLVIIMIIGITSAVVGQSWKIAAKREKEKELLWRGHQFRLAINRYYQARLKGKAAAGAPVNASYYPTELTDLLKDPNAPGTVRYIRKIYTDPMTGKADWALDPPPPPPGGSIVTGDTNAVALGQHFAGVHSISDAEPLKKDNFDLEDIKFKNISGAGRKARYSDWLFDYDPNAPVPGANVVIPTGGTATPGATATPGGTTPGGTPAGGTAATGGNATDGGGLGAGGF